MVMFTFYFAFIAILREGYAYGQSLQDGCKLVEAVVGLSSTTESWSKSIPAYDCGLERLKKTRCRACFRRHLCSDHIFPRYSVWVNASFLRSTEKNSGDSLSSADRASSWDCSKVESCSPLQLFGAIAW